MLMSAGPASYHEVADAVREQITSGELAPGTVIPSEAELGRQFGVSRGTARLALNTLVDDGLITGGQGRKRQVRSRVPLVVYASRSESRDRRLTAGSDAWVDDVEEQGKVPGQIITVEIVQASPVIARLLEIGEGDLVAVRRRVRTIDGAPDNLNDTYYPMELAQEIPEILNPADVPRGVIALMADRGYVQVRYTDELTWRPPLPDETERLALPRGVAILVQTRTGYTAEDRPVKVTVTAWPGDSHIMIYELPA
jgi:GntR family transcriptional regulator